MNKRKLPIYVILIIFSLYSAIIFLTKGIDSGVENWRFYASLFGFLIAATFLFLFYQHDKKNRK